MMQVAAMNASSGNLSPAGQLVHRGHQVRLQLLGALPSCHQLLLLLIYPLGAAERVARARALGGSPTAKPSQPNRACLRALTGQHTSNNVCKA
jgi:hypothetical protein